MKKGLGCVLRLSHNLYVEWGMGLSVCMESLKNREDVSLVGEGEMCFCLTV